MSKPHFWRFKARARKSQEANADNKQTTISKFFTSPNSRNQNKTDACNVPGTNIVEDSSSSSNIPGTKVKTVSSPLRQKRFLSGEKSPSETDTSTKRQRTESHDPSDFNTRNSVPASASGSGSSPIVSGTTLKKLHGFSSTFEEGHSDAVAVTPAKLKRTANTFNKPADDEEEKDDVMEIERDSEEEFEIHSTGSKAQSLLSKFASPKLNINEVQGKSLGTPQPGPSGVNNSMKKTAGKSKYTPLEQQFVEIKEKHPDCLLFVECGYKYRFFGEDAEIASRDLNIYCRLDHNFMTASIPTHRLYVHVRRLVAKGHKVGVVKQMETAALKAAGDNKSAPFTRELAALYTKSTLIGEDVDPVFSSAQSESDTSGMTHNTYLMCVYEPEITVKKGRPHSVSFVAIQPATGDIIYDVFEDGATRAELETRISHIQPVELLLPEILSSATETLLNQLVSVSKTADDRVRLERLSSDVFDVRKALPTITEFYSSEGSEDSTNGTSASSTVSPIINITRLPEPVISCLSALLTYLREFNLHKVLRLTSNIHKFSTEQSHMKLNACTVRNLELFRNQTDGRYRGSLLWVLDQTSTRFGGRMLRHWLSKPLVDAEAINERLDAVTELVDTPSPVIAKLRTIIAHLPDLEKGLCTIFHKKCSTFEFLSVCKSLENIDSQLRLQLVATPIDQQVNCSLLRRLLLDIQDLLEGVGNWTAAVNPVAAKDGDKTELFVDETDFPVMVQRKGEIANVLKRLKDHRREVRLTLRSPALEYKTVLGTEFLVEVRNTNLKQVPADWIKIGSTKAVSRFHSPFILDAYKKLLQLREQLVIDAKEAWMLFLCSFEDCYARYQKAVRHLATLDCLSSLAKVAKQEGFCRPTILANERKIHIEDGRHPVVDMLLGDQEQFVPNSTDLQSSGEHCMVITGPNMGGKSSYIKQVALICILAQMGSYVPAVSAEMGIVDGIFTRMGASDDLYKGRSTFMVELEEAADIIHNATDRSLVILDELGRGTSTHDGFAIAYATLKHFVEDVKCFTLFVTHYPSLADIEKLFPKEVGNHHMSFMIQDEEESSEGSSDSGDVLTFLYQLVRGTAARSYGLNVARLADLPAEVLKVATCKSQELESAILQRREQRNLFQQIMRADDSEVTSLLHKTKETVTS